MRLLIGAALLIAAPAAAEERRLLLPGFDRVRIEGPVEAVVTTARGTSVVVEGERRAVDAIDARVDGRLLVLAAAPGERVTVRVATGAIDAATASGPARLAIDRVRGDRVRLLTSGAAAMEVARVDAARLDAISTGSARLAIGGGRAETATLVARGAASLAADGLDVGDLTLGSETDGEMSARARRTARVTAAAAGSVAVAGGPQCTVRQTGSGSVACGAGARGRR